MSDLNYLTVAEYAAAKHITKQAVYKQLNTKLKAFLVVVDGQKYIDKAALGIPTDADKSTIEPDLNEVEQPLNEVEQPLNNHFQLFLQAQIEEKDKTIESLLRQIESLTQQNERLTDLLHNSQVLLAAEKQQQMLIVQANNKEETEETHEKKSIFSIFRKKNKKL